jgi:hypothetical protein
MSLIRLSFDVDSRMCSSIIWRLLSEGCASLAASSPSVRWCLARRGRALCGDKVG